MAHNEDKLFSIEDPKASKRRFFLYAPPLKGTRPSKRKPPKAPFKAAKPWQVSVFYYWWEYLRRHEGYAQTCRDGGKGEYRKLYLDFGNVHEGSFWDWWRTHQQLFDEPLPPPIRVIAKGEQLEPYKNGITIEVSLDQRLSLTIRQVQRLLAGKVVPPQNEKLASKARYPVHTNPVLASLHKCLVTWDLHKAHPTWTLFLIHDYLNGKITEEGIDLYLSTKDLKGRAAIAGSSDSRITKSMAVRRDIRIAKQYIENVGKGEFPKRSTR